MHFFLLLFFRSCWHFLVSFFFRSGTRIILNEGSPNGEWRLPHPNPKKVYFLAQKVYSLKVFFLAKVFFLQKDGWTPKSIPFIKKYNFSKMFAYLAKSLQSEYTAYGSVPFNRGTIHGIWNKNFCLRKNSCWQHSNYMWKNCTLNKLSAILGAHLIK